MDVVTLTLAKKFALKMNNVGIASAISENNGITWTLKDGTKFAMPITNWHNLTIDEQKVLSMLVPMSNDGGKTYLGSDLKRYVLNQSQVNDNKSYTFTTNDWTKISDNKYTLTRVHNLGDANIIPYVQNSNGKAETVGIDTSIANTITLESTSVFDGKIILNYSTSNANKINTICTINSSYIFKTIADRDTYFGTTNIGALQNGLLCMVNDGTTKTLYTWEDIDSPVSYDSSKWSDSTALIKGETGIGLKPAHKWVNTILQFENQDGSYDSGVNLKGDTGSAGTKLNVRGTYDPLVEYKVDNNSMDVVNYNGKAYACLQTNIGKQPDISNDYWALLLDSVLSVNDWILDTTDTYSKMQMKLVNGDLFDIIKNGSNNKCTVFGDITRSTHIDSSEDIILGKIDNNKDVSFDINTDSSETKSAIQCIFDYTPSHGGYVMAINMELADIQANTQVRFVVKDKITNTIIYQDNYNTTDFTNGTDANCYNVTNGIQTITLNKPFALANPDTHTFEFYFNKTVTIKGKTISSEFVPKCHIVAREISVETVATQEWALNTGLTNVKDAMLPTGVKNGENSFNMSFDDTTRTFNLTLKSGVTSFTYYLFGTRVEIKENKSIQIPDITDIYFIYFDSYGNVNYTTDYSIEDMNKLPLIFIRWNSIAQKSYSQWAMYPDIFIDNKIRTYMLQSTGTTYIDGFGITATVGGDGTSDNQYKFALESGRFAVAERTFNINNAVNPINSYENILNPICNVSNFYRLGNTQGFMVDDISDIPLKKGTVLPYYNSKDINGNWTLQESQTGKYIVSHILVNTSIKANKNIFSIMGQGMSNDLETAKSDLCYSKLDKGNLDVLACKVLYTLYFKVDSTYTNSFKATLVYIEDLKNKSNIEVISTSVIKHNSLSGRADSNSHPSSAIMFDEISPISDSPTAIKIQNADKSKDLVVIDTQNKYINNKVPSSICSMTTTERLALTNIPLYITVFDTTQNVNFQYIGNDMWFQN